MENLDMSEVSGLAVKIIPLFIVEKFGEAGLVKGTAKLKAGTQICDMFVSHVYII
jgi:hypothetical protein